MKRYYPPSPRQILLLSLVLLTLAGCRISIPASRDRATTPALARTPAQATAPAADSATISGPEANTPGFSGKVGTVTATAAAPTQAAPPAELPTAGPTPELFDPGAQEVANYAIQVRLDPAKNSLTGQQTITYHNQTQQPIPDLVFHLYLNAFKSENTIFMRESGAQLRGVPFDRNSAGWIEVTGLQVQGGPALKLALEEDGTLARAKLPEPVAPGGQVTVQLGFKAQLPKVFARTGWAEDKRGDPFFLVGQWFPKLGVWTEKGWNAYPFHGNSEFFADFGRYDVAITLPRGYVTGATGMPTGSAKNADGSQTVSYGARGVIDFAWVASPNLQQSTRKAGDVEVVYLYLPEHDWSVERVLGPAVDAVKQLGEWYGAYPYPRLTVVDVPEDGAGAGGMEYPTFITAGADDGERNRPPTGWQDSLAITTVHEVAHQWFQSLIATNEAEEPWLDEGFADYSTVRYLTARYGLGPSQIRDGNFAPGLLSGRRMRYLSEPQVPMYGKAWDFEGWDEYVTAVYSKPDLAMMTMERALGGGASKSDAKWSQALKTYATRYRFAHPTTADFQKVVSEVLGADNPNLDWFFNGLVYNGKTLNYVAKDIQGQTITIDREGDLTIPVQIQVTFADGSQQTLEWDGQGSQKTFTLEKRSPVRSFVIDPQRRLIIELDWTDNDAEEK